MSVRHDERAHVRPTYDLLAMPSVAGRTRSRYGADICGSYARHTFDAARRARRERRSAEMIERGSPAISTVLFPAARETPSRDVGAQFEALLVASALKPLATALGFYGDAVVASVAPAMFRGQRDAFAERLDALARGDRP